MHLPGSWEPPPQASQIGFLSVALTECLCPHSLAHPTLPQVTFVKSEEFRSEQQMLADTEVKQLVNLVPPGGFEAGVGDCSSRQGAGGSSLSHALCAAPAVPHCWAWPGGNPPRAIWNKGGVSAIWETRHLHGTRSRQEHACSNTLIHSPS